MPEKANKILFDDAIELTGFGKYNVGLLVTCCLLILAMYLDIFGFSVALPAVACDLGLSTVQQGLLSAVPLIGVMISSFCWGLCADTIGRRKTLLVAMPVGAFLNLAAGLAPTYTSLAVLKFLSASFTSSANAAAYALLGESAPQRYRSPFMFLMASTTMFAQLIICVIALPIFQLTFHVPVTWLSLEYRPWRLLLQIISLPGVIGSVAMVFYHESPKFLLSDGREDDAIIVLGKIYSFNTGTSRDTYKVSSVIMDECDHQDQSNQSLSRRIWYQTAPLFKAISFLKWLFCKAYSSFIAGQGKLKKIYVIHQFKDYICSTGYTMWVPTMTNAYFDGEDTMGQTFCEVASRAARINSTEMVHTTAPQTIHVDLETAFKQYAIKAFFATSNDCSEVIQPVTLYAVMCYSGASGVLTILLSMIVGPLGKRATTLLVFSITALSGLLLLFVNIPLLSIALFYVFLYVALILGNVNTYLVELNPTHLRGMATSLSVVIARGLGFFSVQLIATLLDEHCTPMIIGYVGLVISGLIVSYFLPSEVN